MELNSPLQRLERAIFAIVWDCTFPQDFGSAESESLACTQELQLDCIIKNFFMTAIFNFLLNFSALQFFFSW